MPRLSIFENMRQIGQKDLTPAECLYILDKILDEQRPDWERVGVLGTSFFWSKTLEGHAFWAEVRNVLSRTGILLASARKILTRYREELMESTNALKIEEVL